MHDDITCKIESCDRTKHLRGWCKIHYERWQRRRADPEPVYQYQEKGHGMVSTPEWRAWRAMRVRCTKPNCPKYKDYGGRGITVCDDWLRSFTSFYNYIGKRPSDKHSLDRIDNDGNYEPGNIRWATYVEQNNNRRPRS